MSVALLLLFVQMKNPGKEERDLFSQGNYVVAPAQTVGKLLVVVGDAVVAGRVSGWLAVIGGNVVLPIGGVIDGQLFVFGGELRGDAGALNTPSPLSCRRSRHLSPWWGGCWAAAQSPRCWRPPGSSGACRALFGVRPCSTGCWPFCTTTANAGRVFTPSSAGCLRPVACLIRPYHPGNYLQQETELIDRAVIWLVHTFATPAADKAMIVITALGSGVIYAVFAPLTLGWLLWLRRRREAVTLAVCLGGAATLNFLLKHLFERARPDLFKIITAAGYSFPSGHAMVSLCFYGMVAYLLCRRLRRLPAQIAGYSLAAVLVAIIGFSRIYLGVHYPSDVLGGYLAGGTWLAFCVSLLWWWKLDK
jgi:undecaprenyl-diphosphatase